MSYVYSGRITPIYNYEVIREYKEVLSRKKFNLNSDDIVFYELTLSRDGTYLITGNKKHFPDKQFVVTPKEFVSLLNGDDKP